MNLVQISNLFNQITQGLTAPKYYHYGLYSDLNTNIQNNSTGGNTLGKFYPAVSFLYPTEVVEIKEKKVSGAMDITLVFSDTQYYNSTDGTTNQRSILEVHRDLQKLAINFISEVNRIGRAADSTGVKDYTLGVQGNPRFNYLSHAMQDRLCILEATFTIYYTGDCPAEVVDISALPAPFDGIPPSTDDYELE